jgi:serine protease Do
MFCTNRLAVPAMSRSMLGVCREDAAKARVRQAVSVIIMLASPLTCAASGTAPAGYAALVRQVAPSVVTVLVEEQRISAGERAAERATSGTDSAEAEAIIRRLLSGPSGNPSRGEGASSALGSGFIIRADGLVVTNRHVIVDARTVRVRLTDAREVAAQVIGSDAVTDIALLRVNAGRLPTLRLGSSESVSVGDAVIAIGNPFGLGQSVTAGIVSARARTLEDDPYINFLQTDAAVNRGNSGGPLVSLKGTVIGVTSIIFSPSGGSVGLGFAIPAETVTAVVGELEAHGRVDRGYIGIYAQALTPLLATALGMQAPVGALVTALDPEGPAVGSLFIGDVLLSVNSTAVTFEGLSKITARLVPNSLAMLTVMRSGAQQSLAMKVGRLPEPPSNPLLTDGQDTWVPALGFGVADTTSAIRKAIKANDESSGLIITQLRPAGPGALAGLKIGDLITHAGTKQLIAPADIAAINRPTRQVPLLLRVVREGSAGFIAITGEIEP